METLYRDRGKRLNQLDEKFHRLRKYWRDRKEYQLDPFYFEIFWEENFERFRTENLQGLVEL